MFLPLPEGHHQWLSSELKTHHLLLAAKAGAALVPGDHYPASSHSVTSSPESALISFRDKAFQRLLRP